LVVASLRPYIPTALFALLIFYFGCQALTGDRGLLTGARREETLALKRQELKQLEARRMDLEARVRLLGDANLSKDLLDERARVVLGFADPNDYVIRVQRNEIDTSAQPASGLDRGSR
jgi:cell division protein FtsB